jgi:hypothetical protein
MKRTVSYLLLVSVCTLLSGVLPLSAESVDNNENAAKPVAQEAHFFQWAWQLPAETFDDCAITDYSYWTPVQSPFGGGFRFISLRDENKFDELHAGGYFFFRPVLLRLGDSFMSIGGYITFDAFNLEGKTDLPLGYVNNFHTLVKSRDIPVTAGVSMLWALPSAGLQISLEIGHYWADTRLFAPDVLLPVPQELLDINPALEPLSGSVFSNQQETGLDIFFGISWMSERNFLSGISVTVFSNYRTGPVEITSKLNYPEFVDVFGDGSFLAPLGTQVVPDKPAQSSYILSVLYVKAVAIPIDINIPLLMSEQEKNFVTVEPAFGVGYARADHGHVLGGGVRVSVAEVVGFSYFRTWEQRNDRADNDIFMIELGFQLGHRLGPRS